MKKKINTTCNGLSFAQEKIYYLQQIHNNSVCYNQPVRVHIPHALNLDAFSKSLDTIIQRHEILRTTYVETNKEISTVVNKFKSSSLQYYDFSLLPITLATIQANKIATDKAKIPFNLNSDMPYRFLLIKTENKVYHFYAVIHHIAGDGESIFKVFLPELEKEYFERLGTPAQKRNKILTHAQFVQQQREEYLDSDVTSAVSFWKDYLYNSMPIKLPFEKSGNVTIETPFKGRQRCFGLEHSLSDGLQMLARKNKTTVFLVYASLITILIHKYTKSEDISIGTFCSTRNKEEHFRMIEDMTNTIILRTILSDSMSFTDVLNYMKNKRIEMMNRCFLPFQDIIAAVNPGRTFGETPLFNIALVMQPDCGSSPNNWQYSFFDIDVEAAKFPLLFDVQTSSNNTQIKVEYRTDKYSSDSIEQIIKNFSTLAHEVVNAPDKRINQLRIVSKEDETKLLQMGLAKIRYSKKEVLPQLFEKQTKSTPNNIALKFKGTKLTYQQLNQKANQIAHFIEQRLQKELKKDTKEPFRVGLIFNPSIEMVSCIIAVLKLGMSYVPLDPNFPTERLNYIINNCQAKCILTHNECQTMIRELQYDKNNIFCIDQMKKDIAAQSQNDLSRSFEPDREAYIIYTSGTTGMPKGVMISHHNVVRLLKSTEELFNFNSSSQWTLFHSFAFDVSVWEIWGAIGYGGTIHVIPNEYKKDLSKFYDYIADNHITVLCQTNSAFEQLINLQTISSKRFISLETIIFAGEPLKIESVKQWRKSNQNKLTKIINMYGITETTVHSTYGEIHPEEQEIHIGLPLKDINLYLLDENKVPVPIGVVGEIYLSGDCVAKGYLGLESKTKERFSKDLFKGKENTEMMYRSGDYAKWNDNGLLHYIGRIDTQVKIRGYRIELKEIESKILEHDCIKQVIVTVYENSNLKCLVTYYITEDKKNISPEEFQIYLEKHLPKFMVPTYFIPINKMPLTVQGKLNKIALPEPTIDKIQRKSKSKKPCTTLEKDIAKIWGSVLDIEHAKANVNDNFFDIGGTSLLSVQLMKAFHDHGLNLSIQDIFDNPTIEELAKLVENCRGSNMGHFITNSIPTICPIEVNGNNPPLFLIHPSSGFSWEYKSLASKIKNQPIYGLNNVNFGQENEGDVLQEAVKKYISEIKKIRPHGPYYLGGWSSGGVFAYEIAQQLTQRGETVDILIMFDTPYPLSYLSEEMAAEKIDKILGIHNITKDNIEYNDYFYEIQKNNQLMASYVPKPYEGKVVLIRAGKFDKALQDRKNEGQRYLWPDSIIPNLTQYVVNSTHLKMFEEQYVNLLIPILTNELSKIDSSEPIADIKYEKNKLEK